MNVSWLFVCDGFLFWGRVDDKIQRSVIQASTRCNNDNKSMKVLVLFDSRRCIY